METRQLNVSYVKSGSGSQTSRFIIPITWLRELGFTEDDREANVVFDGQKITIQKNSKQLKE